MSLRSRAVHSGAWIGAGFAVQKALQLGSNLILTRLLFPEAFGLMALATVFLVGLAMFSDIGLKPAVIRDIRGDQAEFLNTAWTIQIARGILICAIGAAIAYPISLVYEEPILFPLLALLSITAAISGFTSIAMATAERRLDFKRITIVQVLGQVISIGLLVTLVYFWRSVWALAVANIASAAVVVAIGFALLPRHRHRIALDEDSVRSLIQFGRWILFSTMATYVGGEGLRAIQAGFITPAEFGILAIAYTIAGIPNDLAMKLAGAIGLPVLAETYRASPQNGFTILRALRKRTLAISVLLSSAVILLGEPLVEFLYDPRYHSAGRYLVAIAFANAISAVSAGYTSAVLAVGKASSYFFIIFLSAILRIVGVTVGFEIYGIVGMLYGVGVANLAVVAFNWNVSHKIGLADLRLDAIALITIFFIQCISGFYTFWS
nr:oligosaccharide flippase family protein [Allopontixanthobacter sediminis]